MIVSRDVIFRHTKGIHAVVTLGPLVMKKSMPKHTHPGAWTTLVCVVFANFGAMCHSL